MPRRVTIVLGVGSGPGVITNNRNLLVAGVDKPDGSNTGVLPGVSRRVATVGEVVPGATISNADIPFKVVAPHLGALTPAAGTVRFNNCYLMGANTTPTTSEGCVVATASDACPMIFTDCTVYPQVLSPFRMGFQGWRYQAIRCDIDHCQDGAEVFNINVTTDLPTETVVQQCYVHDFYWEPNNGRPSLTIDGPHDDGQQIEGGSGNIYLGNAVYGYMASDALAPWGGVNYYGDNLTTSCILLKPDVSDISGVQITKNWFEGGQYCLNLIRYKRDGAGNIVNEVVNGNVGTVKANRFKKGTTRAASGNGGININMAKDANNVFQPQIFADWGSLAGGDANLWDDGTVVGFTNGGAA